MTRNLLLISNSTNAGEEYLAWPLTHITGFLSGYGVKEVIFVPYAGISLSTESLQKSYDLYEERVQKIFRPLGLTIKSIHHFENQANAVKNAEAVMVGGGNTFHLIACMYENGLIDAIRQKIAAGMPFVGWSAGSNVACPTIKTTNDMPIWEPASFSALNVVPFQINPHYLDANPDGHAGETRQQRIEEFLIMNKEITVLGLREATLLEIHDDSMQLKGKRQLRVFRFGRDPEEYSPGENIDHLLKG